MAEKDKELIENIEKQEYKYGFTSDIETETIPRGLNEEVVRLISTKKGEPEWMTEFRLKAYRHWLTMTMPRSVASFSCRMNHSFWGALPEPNVLRTTAFNPGTCSTELMMLS